MAEPKDEMPEKKLGEFNGRSYFLYAHATPSFNNIESYVITIFYKLRNGGKVQIARFDDSHGFRHFDKLFEDHPYKNDKPSTPIKSFWELYRYAEENWERWARKYKKED